ncbi:hypothetical protein Sjap_004674 [Stephania japonica]|uniref:Uncharacterized protein n=1 Tax=Stephania japonica TaxID=461633 RepID=A0AAP0K2W8_9MAGN
MKTAALSFSSISTPSPHHSRSLSPSPFHSRCSLSISLPTLVVSHALGHSLPLGLTPSHALGGLLSRLEQSPPPPTSPR